MEIKIKCVCCGKELVKNSRKAIYCSNICGDRFRRKRPPRKIYCKWCSKEEIVFWKKGWDKRKFCSERCRREFHSFLDNRSPFYSKKRNRNKILSNSNLYVKCEICGLLARRRLSTHIKKAHNLHWKEYKEKYPNAQNECEEIRTTVYEKLKEKKITEETLTLKNGWNIITRIKKKKIGNQCELCGYKKYQEALIGHHKLPRHLGGKNELENCIIVCANCHWHIHKLINRIKRRKDYTIEDIVRTCVKTQEAGSKSLR